MGDYKFLILVALIFGFVGVLYISDFIRMIHEYRKLGMTRKEAFKKALEYYFYIK